MRLRSSRKKTRSVTGAAAGIRETLPCLRDELPVIAVGLESQLEDAEGIGVARFAVWFWRTEGAMALPAGAGYELADATRRIRRAIRSLRCEAFVIVIVTVDDYIGVRFIERFPQGFYSQIIAVRAAGAEERLVPVGKCAGDRMRDKIRAEPFF